MGSAGFAHFRVPVAALAPQQRHRSSSASGGSCRGARLVLHARFPRRAVLRGPEGGCAEWGGGAVLRGVPGVTELPGLRVPPRLRRVNSLTPR